MARVTMTRLFSSLSAASLAFSLPLDAQRGGGRGRAGGPPPSPRQAAPIDLAGYWVSPIIEDWKYRMVTPAKGVFDAVPLNAEGRKVGESWDPAKDEAAGRAVPGLRRRRHHAPARAPAHLVAGRYDAESGDRHRHADATASFRQPAALRPRRRWQGHSVAQWNVAARSLRS